jgi:hypothetical protein
VFINSLVTTDFTHCQACHSWQHLTAIYLSYHVKHISRVLIHEQHNYHILLFENNTFSYLDWGQTTKWELSALNMQKDVNTNELPTVQTLSNYTPRHSDNFKYLLFKTKKLVFYPHNILWVSYMIPAVSWDYFSKQHQPVCHCNWNIFCCVWDRTEILLCLWQDWNFVVSGTGLKFCCVWDRTEILLHLGQDWNFVVSETGLTFHLLFSCTSRFQQLNSGDVCVALALNTTHVQVWRTKLLSFSVTARWLH